MTRGCLILVLLLLIIVFFTLPADLLAQCSICTKTAQQLGERPAKALNTGIIYLGLTPFLAGVPAMLENGNGAMRQLARLAELGDVRAVHAEVVDRTRRSAEEALRMATAGAA